ncbi:MAG: CotH kinase family protein [Lachnospiraceae bacterium]|nr:CotH kinase family protein [Lachnospiraceae bacterium]
MGNKMRLFMAVSAGLMLAAVLAVSYLRTDHEKELVERLVFECMADGQKIELKLWEDEEAGRYYLFLPSCFAGKTMDFTLRYEEGKGAVRIDGTVYRRDSTWAEAGKEEIHGLELKSPLGVFNGEKPLQVLASANLPAFMISAEAEEDILDLEEFDNKKYIETGNLLVVDQSGSVVCREKLDKFKVRGNLTASLDKKPFTFTFQNPVSLCGMKSAYKWNLLANATDGSYIRNKLILDLANQSIDAYEPDGEFVEVYLNGVYQGMYLLTEAVQIGENRLEIPEQSSWFLEMELDFRMEEDVPYVISDGGQIFAAGFVSAKPSEELSQIQYMINDIESALTAEDGRSVISGKYLRELIDMGSWAEAFLVQEISGDHDTGIASQFSYVLDKENPFLYAGPVWDFDGTMGNVNTPMFGNPSALTASVCNSRPEGNPNQNRWLSAMYKNPEFQALTAEKYSKVFRYNLGWAIDTGIDQHVEVIRRSAVLDALKWHEKRQNWMFVHPAEKEASAGDEFVPEDDYAKFSDLDQHVEMVREFLLEKKDFLDKLWVEKRDYCVVEVRNDAPFLNQDYNQTLYYWVERGKPLEELPRYEMYHFAGYVNRENGEQVVEGTVIYEDCVLEGIW